MTEPAVDDMLVDYWGIREGIGRAIRSYPGLENLTVLQEPANEPSPEQLPAVLIYLDERDTPEENQRLTAGKTTHHRLVFSLWVLGYSAAGLDVAARSREDTMARVEVALMRDRSLGGLLTKSLTIKAGETQVGAGKSAFVAAMETRVIVEVTTSVA